MVKPAQPPARNVTLQKGLVILETLASEAREFTVTELAKLTGLSASQTCEILATLVAAGYVIRNPQNRRYRIGLRTLELSADILACMVVRRAGLSYIFNLMHETGATTLLGVYHRNAVLLLDTCYPEGRYETAYPGFGSMLSLTATAMGKTLLAHLPEAVRRQCCSQSTLSLLTSELAEIRRTGLGFQAVYEGRTPASQGCGAIVRGAGGEIAAVLGARIDWDKWESCNQDAFCHRVLTAAQGLSRALGYVEGG